MSQTMNPSNPRTEIQFDIIKEFDELNTFDPAKRFELEDYCNDIQNLAKLEIGVLFKNLGNKHAAIVLSNIFLYSTKSIRIYAGDFNGDVSGISIWKKTLEESFIRNQELIIDVILEKGPVANCIAMQTLLKLKQKDSKRVIIGQLPTYPKPLSLQENPLSNFHFTIGDDNKYRIETNTKTYKAVCNFDDKEQANKLIDMFLLMKSFTKVIDL